MDEQGRRRTFDRSETLSKVQNLSWRKLELEKKLSSSSYKMGGEGTVGTGSGEMMPAMEVHVYWGGTGSPTATQ